MSLEVALSKVSFIICLKIFRSDVLSGLHMLQFRLFHLSFFLQWCDGLAGTPEFQIGRLRDARRGILQSFLSARRGISC
jgi:hypothetical protein